MAEVGEEQEEAERGTRGRSRKRARARRGVRERPANGSPCGEKAGRGGDGQHARGVRDSPGGERRQMDGRTRVGKGGKQAVKAIR